MTNDIAAILLPRKDNQLVDAVVSSMEDGAFLVSWTKQLTAETFVDEYEAYRFHDQHRQREAYRDAYNRWLDISATDGVYSASMSLVLHSSDYT